MRVKCRFMRTVTHMMEEVIEIPGADEHTDSMELMDAALKHARDVADSRAYEEDGLRHVEHHVDLLGIAEDDPTKKRVYTIGYFPFTMGGSVHRPICATVLADGPHDIGDGYKGWVVVAPNGKTFVAEDETGAFIGPTLKQVRRDIAAGEVDVMVKQVANAREESKRAQDVGPDKLWAMLKCGAPVEELS